MHRLSGWIRKNVLVLVFGGTLLPVALLLALQFSWLSRLEEVSLAARQAVLRNYLEGVGTSVEYHYRSSAERLLNLPPGLFRPGPDGDSGPFWLPREVEGIRRLFVVDFTRHRSGEVRLYDARGPIHETAPELMEALAISNASAPWQTAPEGEEPRRSGLCVDERDPRCRMVMNPIADADGRVVGLAGMILDEEFFRHTLLPRVIEGALPSYFPNEARNDIVVKVRDSQDQIVMASRPVDDPGAAVTRNFPFVFTDWTLNLHGGTATPQRWARASLTSNMALAVLLTLLVVGGLFLALHSARKAMRLSELKSDFVSNVSHELRTPVASIRMFAELLRLGRVRGTDRVQEYGRHIEAESQRLSRLIDNILDFSRIDSGQKSYRPRATDPTGLVLETATLFEVRLQDSGFRLELDLPKRPAPMLVVDPEAISQALQNLVENAVKYSGDGREILLRLEAHPGEVTIAVRDRGIGIPAAEQRRIFERFHRVGSSLVHDVKGSGLGLAIVHHIMAAHGGRVTVESTPGRGSTFTLHLPASGAAEEAQTGGAPENATALNQEIHPESGPI